MTPVPAPKPRAKLAAIVSAAQAGAEAQPSTKQLRDTVAVLTSAQRLARLGSWVFDVETQRLTGSQETHRICGVAPHEFDGTYGSFLRHVHPDDRKALGRALGQALAGQSRFSYSCRLCRQDGAQRLIQGEGETRFGPDGKPRRLVGTVMDVTEREQERLALRESEARFRSLTALSTDWYWEQDDQLRFTEFFGGGNARWERNRQEMKGKARWELTGCVPLTSDWAQHRATLLAREPFRDFEYRKGTDPDAQYISVCGEPMYGPDGRFTGYRGTARDISERKRAEEQVRQAQAHLDMAMRLGRLGAWTVDVAAMTVTWSSESLAIPGLAENFPRTVGDLLDLLDAGSGNAVGQALTACIRDGTPFDVEGRISAGRTGPVWLRLIGEAGRDAQGCIKCIQGAAQDITAKKMAAERAANLGERLTSTLESATDCFFTVDREWCFTYVNHEAERVLQRSRDDLLGKAIWQEFPEMLGTVFHSEYERALAEFVTVEFEAWHPLGMWLRVNAFPSLRGLAVYFHDITDSRSVREALVDSEQQYRMLFQSSIDGILQSSPDGTILRANPACCAMFGMTEEEICRAGRDRLVAPGEGRLSSFLDERHRHGTAKGELTMIRADGSRFTAEIASAEYLSSDGTTCVSAVIRDITERLRSQQEILMLNAQLEERVRQRTAQLEAANAELKAFAHSLAHDLRSPVAAIDGFGDMLDRSLGTHGTERDRHYLRRIRAAARQMDEFTEALLSLASISQASLQVEEVDLSALAGAVLRDLQERNGARTVVAQVQEGVLARGDRRLLKMALENLLGNAWKFSSGRDIAQISFGSDKAPDGADVFRVKDNGAGFDMAHSAKLFGNFQRLHSQSEFPGTGIGLANVQRIVSRHGGRVWAESALGEGASFYFTLEATP